MSRSGDMAKAEAKGEEVALLCAGEEAALLGDSDGLAQAKLLYENQRTAGEDKEAKRRSEDAALVDPLALGTAALLVGAFVDAVCSALYDVPLKYYLYDTLDVSVRSYYVLSACTSLPSTLLPLFGLLSLAPVRGCHHKWYWILGYLLCSACYLALGCSGTPSFGAVTVWLTLAAVGSSLRSTMLAMLTVERTRHEPLGERGLFSLYLASAAYFGAFVGQALASFLYENELGLGSWAGLSIAEIFLVVGIAPLVLVLPLASYLREVPAAAGRSTAPIFARAAVELRSIYDALRDKRVGCLLVFGIAMYLLTVTNAAHSYLLLDGCGVSEPEYCWLKIVQDLCLWGTIVAYRRHFFDWDLRTLFVGAYAVRTLAKLGDVGAVLAGAADSPTPCLLWVGSDDVVYDSCDVVAGEVLTIVLLLCLARRSPRDASERSAGMAYLALASVLNVAGSLSDVIDVYLEDIWDVNTDKLEAHEYGGYWRLELLTACVPIAVLAFLPLLPRTRADAALKEDGVFAPWASPRHGDAAATAFLAFWAGGAALVLAYSVTSA